MPIKTQRVILVLCLFVIVSSTLCGCIDDSQPEMTITEMFEAEGGVAAYRVFRQYGGEYYAIIDFNEGVIYTFGGRIALMTIPIKNITDTSFEANGKRFTGTVDNLQATNINFTRTNKYNIYIRVDLESAQQLYEEIKSKHDKLA